MKRMMLPLALTLMLLTPALPWASGSVPDPGTWTGGPLPQGLPSVQPVSFASGLAFDGDSETADHSSRATGAHVLLPEDLATRGEAPHRAATTVLAELDEEQRHRALIQLEPLGSDHDQAMHHGAAEVASWWNDGHHEQALAALERLEARGASFAVSISWAKPIASVQKRWYPDVRIGGNRDGATEVVLDFHAESDHLFAAVAWFDGWTMNISTDNGASWAETYVNSSDNCIIGMAVAGDHAWVAYSPLAAWDEVRMRRFHVADGSVDTGYSYQVVADVGDEAVMELTLGTNADDFDNRIFPAVITDAAELRFYWSDLTGQSFSEMSPPATDAYEGLDFTWNKHDMSGYVGYVSYISLGMDVTVWRVNVLGQWDQVLTAEFDGARLVTGVSAYQGSVYTVYDHEFTGGLGIRYQISYDNGETWQRATIYQPSPGDPIATSADVSVHSGVGSAVVYTREEDSWDRTFHTTRRGYGPGAWTDPSPWSTHEIAVDLDSHIEWLGTDRVMSYGMVYLTDDRIPFFDLLTPRAFFADAFESGDVSSW